MRRVRMAGIAALGALVVLVLAVGTAYALDARSHDGEVAGHVTLAGRSIAGMNRAELTRAVADLAARHPGAKVTVRASGTGFETTAETLGIQVDQAKTVADALETG